MAWRGGQTLGRTGREGRQTTFGISLVSSPGHWQRSGTFIQLCIHRPRVPVSTLGQNALSALLQAETTCTLFGEGADAAMGALTCT